MQTTRKLLILALFFSVSPAILAETNNSAPKEGVETRVIEAKRGNNISLKDLSLIADLASARDEQGKTVTLSDENYTIGAYSSSTISVVSSGNQDANSLITLDLLKKP